MNTRTNATQYVTDAITGPSGETSAADFDIDGIVDDLYALAGSWDFDTIAHDAFWVVVAGHDKADA